MVGNESLEGVPLLVLGNKQDIDGCLSIRDIKSVFNDTAHRIGRRDCLVLPVSALKGCVFQCCTFNFFFAIFT